MEAQQDQMAVSENLSLSILTGIFPDRGCTEKAYNIILDKGYDKLEISIIMSGETHDAHFFEDKGKADGDVTASNANSSIAVGSVLGFITGAAISIGAGAIIPKAKVMATGPVAVALAGAGGIIGALVGHGIEEYHARQHEHKIINGRIVLGVHPHNEEDADYFERSWKENNAEIIYRQDLSDL